MNDDFHRRLQDFFEVDYLFPVGSGTVGLTYALQVSNVEGKYVLIPAFTCPNVAISVWAAGGIPKVVDVSPTSLCLAPETVQDALDEDVAAIVAVDAFGCPAPVEELADLVHGSRCTVIDDACQAYGSVANGNRLGSRGDLGVVSFGYSKPVSVNAGGLVMTDSPRTASRLRKTVKRWFSTWQPRFRNSLALRLMRRDSPRLHYWMGIALGLFSYDFPSEKLNLVEERWDTFQDSLSRSKELVGELRELLSRLRGVDRVIPQSNADWLPWRLSLYLETPEDRDRLRDSFTEVGVSTSTLYKPLTDFSWTLKRHSDLSTAHELYQHVLNVCHGSTHRTIRETVETLRPLCNTSSRYKSN